jgi:hypothetical protein
MTYSSLRHRAVELGLRRLDRDLLQCNRPARAEMSRRADDDRHVRSKYAPPWCRYASSAQLSAPARTGELSRARLHMGLVDHDVCPGGKRLRISSFTVIA